MEESNVIAAMFHPEFFEKALEVIRTSNVHVLRKTMLDMGFGNSL